MTYSLSFAAFSTRSEGLTRSVALVQGPPGTGKTFAGVQLVKGQLIGFRNTLSRGQQLTNFSL